MAVTLTQNDNQTLVDIGTNKALDITTYQSNGKNIAQKSTFRAEALFSSSVAIGTVFSIYGSSSKVVKVQKLLFQATYSSTVAGFVTLTKTRTPVQNTGTVVTPVALSGTQTYSTASVRYWTGTAPDKGEAVGVVAMKRTPFATTGATAKSELLEFDFTSEYHKPVTLRGINEGIEVTYQGAAGTYELYITVIFTEEE